MPSNAPRRMTTTRRLSIGAEASARVVRPIVAVAASPRSVVRRVSFIGSAPLEFGAGQQQGHGFAARAGAANGVAGLRAEQRADRGICNLHHIAIADTPGEAA